MKGTIEERILSVRHHILSGSTAVDDTSQLAMSLAEGAAYDPPGKHARLDDEKTLGARKYDRLKHVEVPFGYDAEKHAVNTPEDKKSHYLLNSCQRF